MIKRLQNRIAESRWALPVCSAYAVAVCLLDGLLQEDTWMQFVLTGVATLLVVELNNSNALIRIYSRMVSCSFLALTLLEPQTIESLDGCIVSLCILAFYLILSRAYQDKTATGCVFYAFAAIGIASMVWVQMLFYVPLLWILLASNILAMSPKTFFASILGLTIPYWFQLAYFLYLGDITPIGSHFAQLAEFGAPFILNTPHWEAGKIFIVILTIMGAIHFIRTSFKDKIRTRMLYEMFIAMAFVTIALIIAQPQHVQTASRILIVSTAVLTGHFIALTSTKLTNITTIAIIVATIVITAFNLWM